MLKVYIFLLTVALSVIAVLAACGTSSGAATSRLPPYYCGQVDSVTYISGLSYGRTTIWFSDGRRPTLVNFPPDPIERGKTYRVLYSRLGSLALPNERLDSVRVVQSCGSTLSP